VEGVMIDPDLAVRAALANTLQELGHPNEEADVDEFIRELRANGYVIERLDRRTEDELPAEGTA
jgi:hypothetical protein